jgi:hypothetical protein
MADKVKSAKAAVDAARPAGSAAISYAGKQGATHMCGEHARVSAWQCGEWHAPCVQGDGRRTRRGAGATLPPTLTLTDLLVLACKVATTAAWKELKV